jgi:hypothetical protein
VFKSTFRPRISHSSSLPQETLALYENKGRLLNRIEEMNRVARIAFYDQNEIAGQFNKDVLRRRRSAQGGHHLCAISRVNCR